MRNKNLQATNKANRQVYEKEFRFVYDFNRQRRNMRAGIIVEDDERFTRAELIALSLEYILFL